MAVNMSLKVLVVVTALLLQTARAMVDYDALWRDYNHVPTPCESASCMAGGCLYENCDKPVSCRGGMCFFRYVRLPSYCDALLLTSHAC